MERPRRVLIEDEADQSVDEVTPVGRRSAGFAPDPIGSDATEGRRSVGRPYRPSRAFIEDQAPEQTASDRPVRPRRALPVEDAIDDDADNVTDAVDVDEDLTSSNEPLVSAADMVPAVDLESDNETTLVPGLLAPTPPAPPAESTPPASPAEPTPPMPTVPPIPARVAPAAVRPGIRHIHAIGSTRS